MNSKQVVESIESVIQNEESKTITQIIINEVSKITAQIIIEEATVQSYECAKLIIQDHDKLKQIDDEIKNLTSKISLNKRRVELIKTKHVEYAEKNYKF